MIISQFKVILQLILIRNYSTVPILTLYYVNLYFIKYLRKYNYKREQFIFSYVYFRTLICIFLRMTLIFVMCIKNIIQISYENCLKYRYFLNNIIFQPPCAIIL